MANIGFSLTMSKRESKGVGVLLARASSASLFIMVAGAGLSFLVQMLSARLLGVTEYGIYIYALTWINILSLFVTFGLDTSLLRFVPAYMESSDWALLRGVLKYATIRVLVAGLIVAIITSVVVWSMEKHGVKIDASIFFAASLLLPLTGLGRLRSATLRGLRQVAKATIPENVVRPIIFLILLWVGFKWLDIGGDAIRLMALNVIAALAAFALGTFFLYRALPKEIKGIEYRYRRDEWLMVSVPMLFISGMHLLLKQTDIVMLGMFASTDLAGIYAVATRISDLAIFGLIAANSIVAPMISSLYTRGDHVALKRLIALSTQGVFVFSLVVTLLLWLMAPYLFPLFGADFAAGYDALRILLVAQLINAISGAVGFLMTMTKHQVAAAWILAVAAVMNILLNYMLIPKYGIEGAAVATACTMTLWNIAMVIFVIRKLKINPTVFSKLLVL